MLGVSVLGEVAFLIVLTYWSAPDLFGMEGELVVDSDPISNQIKYQLDLRAFTTFRPSLCPLKLSLLIILILFSISLLLCSTRFRQIKSDFDWTFPLWFRCRSRS